MEGRQTLVEFMSPPIDTDIRINEDNEDALEMPKNRFISKQTTHVGIKHHIIRNTAEGLVRD